MPGADLYIEEEEAKTRGMGLKFIPRLWPFFKPYQRRIIVAGLMLLTSAGLGLIGPLLVKHAIDFDIKNGDVRGLLRTALIYLAVEAVSFALRYTQRIQLAVVRESAAADLKAQLYRHVIKLPMSFFDRNPVGRLITRTESDTEAVKQLFADTAVTLSQNAVQLIGMTVVMLLVNWRLYLMIAVLFPAFLFIFSWAQRRMRKLYLGIRRTIAEIINFIAESLRGLPVAQAFNRQDFFGAKMDCLNRDKYRKEMQALRYGITMWSSVDIGSTLGTVLVLGLGGVWTLQHRLTIGALFLFYSYLSQLFAPIRGLSGQLNLIQRAFASSERMLGIFDTPVEQAGRTAAPAPGFTQALQVQNLDFAYQGQDLVLKDINLTVTRGEKVALIGETGGGKSSIVSLVLKFYEPTAGRILIDGRDLNDLDNRSLRRQIGFVPQEVILFPGTVLDNLRLFDPAVSRDTVMNAARRVWLHERILQFPQGYDTSLVERGVNLSLGERQLLAFARALVFNPEILILDEATSSVDPHTEHLIQEGLEALLEGRTAIIVAHRLATIRMVDRIVVVHEGRIVQEGPHDSLIAQDGYYRRLYRMQYLSQES